MVRSAATPRVSNHEAEMGPILRDGAARLLRMRYNITRLPLFT
jgi:hypothetical protein